MVAAPEPRSKWSPTTFCFSRELPRPKRPPLLKHSGSGTWPNALAAHRARKCGRVRWACRSACRRGERSPALVIENDRVLRRHFGRANHREYVHVDERRETVGSALGVNRAGVHREHKHSRRFPDS